MVDLVSPYYYQSLRLEVTVTHTEIARFQGNNSSFFKKYNYAFIGIVDYLV